MATRSHHRPDGLTEPGALIDLIPLDAGSLVVGFEPEPEHLAVHLAPLPNDDRGAAAGLFGMRGAPGWCAAGVVVHGRARRLLAGAPVGEAVARLVVGADGTLASDLRIDGRSGTADGAGAGRPEGLMVDALHRMLGLPAPGPAPSAVDAALAVWSDVLLAHVLAHGPMSWAQAVGLHPGHPTAASSREGDVDASVETVVAATRRLAEDLDWSRMHRRASSGHSTPPDLTGDEVAWMDATMYGRWLIGSLPDPRCAVDALRSEGSDRAAQALESVIGALVSTR